MKLVVLVVFLAAIKRLAIFGVANQKVCLIDVVNRVTVLAITHSGSGSIVGSGDTSGPSARKSWGKAKYTKFHVLIRAQNTYRIHV